MQRACSLVLQKRQACPECKQLRPESLSLEMLIHLIVNSLQALPQENQEITSSQTKSLLLV